MINFPSHRQPDPERRTHVRLPGEALIFRTYHIFYHGMVYIYHIFYHIFTFFHFFPFFSSNTSSIFSNSITSSFYTTSIRLFHFSFVLQF